MIRPALIWCDQRSQRQVDEINTAAGPDTVLRATANPVLTGFTLPKLLWVRDNEPEKYSPDQARSAAEGLRSLQIDGRVRNGCLRRQRHGSFRRLEPQVVRRNVQRARLGPIDIARAYESSAITGRVSDDAARATGLRAGHPVVAGAGDQAASADRQRNRRAGRTFRALSALRVSSSPIWKSLHMIRQAAFTRFAMRFPELGTSWE